MNNNTGSFQLYEKHIFPNLWSLYNCNESKSSDKVLYMKGTHSISLYAWFEKKYVMFLYYSTCQKFPVSEALVVHTDVRMTSSAVLISPTANLEGPHCLEMTYSANYGMKVSFDFFLSFDNDARGVSKSMGGLPIAADSMESSFNLNETGRDLQVKGLVDMPEGSYRVIIRLRGDYLCNIAIHRIQVSQGRCREPGTLYAC